MYLSPNKTVIITKTRWLGDLQPSLGNLVVYLCTYEFMFLTQSLTWGIFFLTVISYLLIVFSISTYLVSLFFDLRYVKNLSRSSKYVNISGNSSIPFLFSFLLLLLLWTSLWSGPCVTSCFGHLMFSSFERKILMLITVSFLLYLVVYLSGSDFSNLQSFDYLITLYHLTYWLFFLFMSTNILTTAFVIEVLTSLIMLLLVTSFNCSTYSSQDSLRSTKVSMVKIFNTTYLYTILTFFWTSLISTLILFLFVILFYSKYFTMDWSLIDTLSSYFLNCSLFFELSSISFSWSFVILSIFIKCAITPFYFWKINFFKGMSVSLLFYYISVFYFILFFYFLYLIVTLFTDLLFFNLFLFMLIVLLSTVLTPFILYETLNIKSFLALSSIMNSSLLLLVVLSNSSSSTHLFY
jgi:hypothetical protein